MEDRAEGKCCDSIKPTLRLCLRRYYRHSMFHLTLLQPRMCPDEVQFGLAQKDLNPATKTGKKGFAPALDYLVGNPLLGCIVGQ